MNVNKILLVASSGRNAVLLDLVDPTKSKEVQMERTDTNMYIAEEDFIAVNRYGKTVQVSKGDTVIKSYCHGILYVDKSGEFAKFVQEVKAEREADEDKCNKNKCCGDICPSETPIISN